MCVRGWERGVGGSPCFITVFSCPCFALYTYYTTGCFGNKLHLEVPVIWAFPQIRILIGRDPQSE